MVEKWTFRPIMHENNEKICAKFDERGGARRIGTFPIRLQIRLMIYMKNVPGFSWAGF